MRDYIEFGSKKISFHLTYTGRKSLGITVTPGMEVLVKAPHGAPADKIREKLKKRAPWILKQQDFFLSFEPKNVSRRYVSGESHLYMGRQYRLKVLPSKKNAVHYSGRFIEVHVTPRSEPGEVLNEWYKHRAKMKFAEIAEPLIQRFRKYKVEPEALYIQHMPTRWGSCTPAGKIILNPELIKAPKPCIEYVIVHELCHLVHANHTRKFMELQAKEMPDWEKWKRKLEVLLA